MLALGLQCTTVDNLFQSVFVISNKWEFSANVGANLNPEKLESHIPIIMSCLNCKTIVRFSPYNNENGEEEEIGSKGPGQ